MANFLGVYVDLAALHSGGSANGHETPKVETDHAPGSCSGHAAVEGGGESGPQPAAGTPRHDGARFTDVQKRRLARLVVIAALVTGAVTGTALGAGGCGGATAGDGVTSPPSSSGT